MSNLIKSILSSSWARLFFWSIAIGVMLYFPLRNVNLSDVRNILREAQTQFIILALFSIFLNVWAKAARWEVLLGPSGKQIGMGKLIISLVSGQTLNWFLPGRVGELSRAYVIGGLGPGRTFVLGTVALEKVLDMISYALLFLILLLTFQLPVWIQESGFTLILLAAVLGAGVVALASNPDWFSGLFERLISWLPMRVNQQIQPRIQSGLSSLKVIRKRQDLIKMAFWSAIVWGTAIWTNDLAARALNLDLPLTASLLVLVVLQAGISVPTIPGRIGIFQYLCIISLALFEIAQANALSFGILLQALVLIPTTIMSIGSIWVFGDVRIKEDLKARDQQ
jgi:glycosyltransferase 2 family protein